MNSSVQQIKERLDIVDFIGSYITLLPAGKNFKAICPFHKEKTPSFMVSPERQTWHCFGSCGEGGDIFKFLMKYENLEFYEALKILAEKAGVELKKISPAEHKQFEILYEINQSAKDFFVSQLKENNGKEALKYLIDRGLKKETIEEFELGLCSQDFDKLTRYLIKLGYDIRDIERAGLNYKKENGGYVDRFRGRITFPIHNHFGKIVGFSGRILPQFEKPEIGKYVNSPETPIFNKSRLLYGFYKAKDSVRNEKSVVIVEGQMDFLMLYQSGINNTVASSGTALTSDHLKTLSRLTDKLILYFDNDEAGFNAIERAIDLAGALDFSVKILTLKDFKDPAEAVQKSLKKVLDFIKKAKPAMEFYFDRYLSIENQKKKEVDLSEFKKNIRTVLGKIKNLASAVERNYWIKELSLRTKVEEKSLMEETESLKPAFLKKTLNFKSVNQNNDSEKKKTITRRDLIAQRLISLMNIKDDFREQVNKYIDFLPVDYFAIFKNITEKEELKDERLVSLLNLINLRSSFEISVLGEEKIEEEFKELIFQLRIESLKEKKEELCILLREAEKNNDDKKAEFVLREFNEILAQMPSSLDNK
ncbi:DNA primase [Candidatus Wolfebacteria bacterium]|nr:DNA primase [Candidatus Wolfebacteria bacterium]